MPPDQYSCSPSVALRGDSASDGPRSVPRGPTKASISTADGRRWTQIDVAALSAPSQPIPAAHKKDRLRVPLRHADAGRHPRLLPTHPRRGWRSCARKDGGGARAPGSLLTTAGLTGSKRPRDGNHLRPSASICVHLGLKVLRRTRARPLKSGPDPHGAKPIDRSPRMLVRKARA
jgi:hypothetical protein